MHVGWAKPRGPALGGPDDRFRVPTSRIPQRGWRARRTEVGLARLRHSKCVEIGNSRFRLARLCPPYISLQMKLAELAVLCPNPTHGAGDRPHHDGVGLDQSLAKSNPLEHRPGGNTRRSEKTVSRHHVFHMVILAPILDAHLSVAR